MSEDAELLRQYAQSGSETAFAELVGGHLPLVYATALRQGCSDGALAKDVAQTVFIDLARKASSLLGRELLAGWLYTSTRLAASKVVRGEHRRQLREQIAASMQEQTTPPESQADQAELRLVLDEAMSELDAGERNAVLIRFFQGKELKEVGSALGISEDAARMRITRALANLQTLLKQRGVTITTVALGTALATEAAIAVPAGFGGRYCGHRRRQRGGRHRNNLRHLQEPGLGQVGTRYRRRRSSRCACGLSLPRTPAQPRHELLRKGNLLHSILHPTERRGAAPKRDGAPRVRDTFG